MPFRTEKAAVAPSRKSDKSVEQKGNQLILQIITNSNKVNEIMGAN